MKLNLDIQPFGRSELEVAERYRIEFEDAEPQELGVRGVLTVDNTDGRVLLTGELDVEAPAVCDRCLGDFTQTYPAELDVQIVRTGQRRGEDEQDSDEYGSWIVHQAQGEVELDGPLREASLLAQPQKRICQEDCKGLCSVCGGNRNVTDCDCDDEPTDPRWDALPD